MEERLKVRREPNLIKKISFFIVVFATSLGKKEKNIYNNNRLRLSLFDYFASFLDVFLTEYQEKLRLARSPN